MRDYVYSDLYFDAHLDKQMKIEVVGTGITIDNSMIELDAFELDESLCSESELTFGCCESNSVKFTVRNMPGSIKGKTLKITETIDGNTDAPFPYGVYKVYSDVPTADRTKREITAYDAMYDIINADVKSWYAGLQFPMTLRQFRDSFFAYLGITQKEVTLVNDSMTVNKTLAAAQTDSESTITEESSISGKMVITAICEINGVFGNIDRDGDFDYVELKEISSAIYPADDLYPSDDIFPSGATGTSVNGQYITFDYEDFISKPITQLEIRQSGDSAGTVVGTSGNNYAITANFLVSDKTVSELDEIAMNILSVIQKASYTPIKSSQIVGNPCIEIGDPIRFTTTQDIVESYVLQRTLTGIQNKRDSIISAGTENHSTNINSIRDTIEIVQQRTNRLERTAEHTLSELSDLSENTASRFEQTASQIQTEVTRAREAEEQLSSSITQTAEQISLKVSKGEVSSEISMENSQIVISGDRIIIDSTNFKLSETGGIKASDIYILGGMITGALIVSENYYERDENGDLILDENGNPIETGEGTIINLLDGSSSFAGEYNYAWLDEEAEVHKAKIYLGKGRLVIEDLDKSKKLYYSYEGISTTEDGNDASGVIDFRSGMFGQSKGGTTYSGITVKTKGSPVALLSETNHCIISPRKLQGIMDNSDMATWDKFVFGLWNRYEADSEGQPDYTQKRDTVRAGNGYIAFGKRKYDESTGEYDYGTILEFGSKNENGGDYGTVYVNDKNNGQGKGKIIASNIPKAVVDVVVTQNESRQITKLVCTLEDGDKENIAVEYDSSGNVTKIGGTTISGWS